MASSYQSDAAWWLRLPSVIAGVLTVYAGASTAGIIAGRRAALCTALVLAVAPILLYYSRDAKMYAWVFLWLMCIIRAAVLYAAPPHHFRHLALYVIAGTALCYTHFAAPLFLAVSGLGFLVCFARNVRVVVHWCLANALILVLALPFIVAEVRYQSVMRHYLFHAHPPDLYSLYIAFAHFFTAYTRSGVLLMAASLFLGLVILLGLFLGRGRRASMAFLTLLGLGPVLLLYVLSSLATWSLFVDRYIMASALPLLLVASITLASIKNRSVTVIGLLLCLFLSAFALPDVYYHTLPKDPRQRRGLIARPDAPKMADILRCTGVPDDIVLHPSWETEPVLKWYAPEFTHVLADYQDSMNKALSNLAPPEYLAFYGWEPVDVRRATASVSRVWLVLPSGDGRVGTHYDSIVEALARQGSLVFSEACGAAILQCYDLSDQGRGARWPRKKAVVAFPNDLGGGRVELQLDTPAYRDETPFEIILRNHTEREVTFKFEAVPCDMAVPGNVLTPCLNADSKWSHGPYLAATARRTATQFRVHPKACSEDKLEACLKLRAGKYAVYLERTREGKVYTIPAATIHVELTGKHAAVFSSPGGNTGTAGGWAWERLGTVHVAGDSTEMTVFAEDPQQRPEAYAVFSQIVFVKAGTAAETTFGTRVVRGHVTCLSANNTTKRLPFGKNTNCVLVQGTVLDASVCLINLRTEAAALLPFADCSKP